MMTNGRVDSQTSIESLKRLLQNGFKRLRFHDSLESLFQDYFFEKKFWPSHSYIWFGIAVFISFLILDRITLPQFFNSIAVVRVSITILLVILMFAQKKVSTKRFAYISTGFGLFAINAGVTYVDILGMQQGNFAVPIGTLFIAMFLCSVVAIPFRYTLVFLVMMLSFYTLGIYTYTGLGDGGLITLTILFVFIGIMGLISSYQREYEARREYIQQLIIDNKSRTIQSMLDNTPVGIITVRENLLISDCSKTMKTLFNDQDLRGLDISRLFDRYFNVEERTKGLIYTILTTSFGEPIWSFDVNSSNLPSEVEIQVDGDLRYIDISWNPIEVDNLVTEFLITFKDLTKTLQAQKEKDKADRKLRLMGLIHSTEKKRIYEFFQSSRMFIEDSINLVNQNKFEDDVLRTSLARVHTLKGNSGLLGFKDFENECHKLEQHMTSTSLQKRNIEVTKSLERLGSIYREYQQLFESSVNDEESNDVRLGRETVDKILSALSQKNQNSELLKTIEDIAYPNLESVLISISKQVKDLAKTLEKPTPDIHIDSKSRHLLDDSTDELLRNVFVHLIRNSMDHGIESAGERKEKNKLEQGQISFLIREDAEFVTISYFDDGRGLAIDKLKRKIEIDGNPNGVDFNDPKAVAETIFDSGLSTSESVSHISGRGVGMDAVRAFLKDQHCAIDLSIGELVNGYAPVTFMITIPKTLVKTFDGVA